MQKMKGFKDVDQETNPMGSGKRLWNSVVMDSIFGLIFAAILRKKKPAIHKFLKNPRNKSMDISVIVPLLNEEESLPELTAWMTRVMDDYQFTYEVILVDDGSTDSSWNVIESLHAKERSYKGYTFPAELWEVRRSE